MAAKSNMKIWDAVSKTDPAHTKEVSFGRKFTAIDAHYQIMSATAQFGPVGEGWGYINEAPIFSADGLVVVGVTVWHGSRENTFGPVPGTAKTLDTKGKPDADAPKKAATDGLTKALSHLGFNADVFLGKFEDNKYVQETAAEFKRQSDPNYEAANAIMSEMEKAADMEALKAILVKEADTLANIKLHNAGLANTVGQVYKKMEAKFND